MELLAGGKGGMDATKVYQDYRYETDEEIEPKRKVIRSLILNGQDVDYNETRLADINRVVHERQRAKQRRELLAELTGWGNAGGNIRWRCSGRWRHCRRVPLWAFVAQKLGL